MSDGDPVSVTPRNCVLIASRKSLTRDLLDIVQEATERQGLTLTFPDESITPGQSFADSIRDKVIDAVAVVAIVGKDDTPNTWFELGMASALNSNVILLDPSDPPVVPLALTSTLRVGPVISASGVELALRRLAQRRSSGRPASYPAIGTGVPLGEKGPMLLEELKGVPTGSRDSGRSFELWFGRVLAAAEVPNEHAQRVTDESTHRGLIDYVVAADELRGNLGALLPVELLIGRQKPRVMELVRSRTANFRQYMRSTGAEAVLVVIRDYVEPAQIVASWDGSLIISSADELVRTMQTETFGNAVLKLWNTAIDRGDDW